MFGDGSTGTGGPRAIGRLYQRSRFNHPTFTGDPSPTVATIQETYAYDGDQGRVSDVTTSLYIGSAHFNTFSQGYTYDDLGHVAEASYPRLHGATGPPGTSPITERFYTNGSLTSVSASNGHYLNAITYHPNGLWKRITRAGAVVANRMADEQSVIDNMARPGSVKATGNGVSWQSGVFDYDGAGNVIRIGESRYRYDRVSRLVSADVFLEGPGGSVLFADGFETGDTSCWEGASCTSGGSLVSQLYSYDAFGNRIGNEGGLDTPVDPATNRLSSNATYDAVGNQTTWSGNTYEYDDLNMLLHYNRGKANDEWIYVYNADDERVLSFKVLPNGSRNRWTLRDLDGSVLRELLYTVDAGGTAHWGVEGDLLHVGGRVLAKRLYDDSGPIDTHHLHLDHLGTPRLVTDQNGQEVSRHTYMPFGEEIGTPDFSQRMKFTGHERDIHDDAEPTTDLDYMHARHYNPQLGRFLSTDSGKDWDPETPQSWNLYAYVRGNPVKSTDPTGKCTDQGGKGTRICIQTFIPMSSYGGFKGDARGPQSDGGTFRTSQWINVSSSDSRAMIDESFKPGTSQLGKLRREAEVANNEVLPTADGLEVSAAASDGLLFGAAPNLEYDLTIRSGSDGELVVTGSHTKFPSLEVWAYQDGEEPKLIYKHEAPATSFIDGFVDINRSMAVTP